MQLGSCRADSRQRQRSPLQAPYARPARPPPPNEQPVAEGDGLRVRVCLVLMTASTTDLFTKHVAGAEGGVLRRGRLAIHLVTSPV